MNQLVRCIPVAALAIAALALAHGGGAHYKGTVKAVGDKQLSIETEEKEDVTVLFDEKTKFEKESGAATAGDLAIGARVVIHTAKAEGAGPARATVVKIGSAPAQKVEAGGPTLSLSVTEDGFEPGKLTVKKGEPVKLVVTRKTDKTCAKELVIDDPPVRAELPLNEAVTVAFTPRKSGQLKYGCGMGKMVGGVIVVE